jgi:hypothetical protein
LLLVLLYCLLPVATAVVPLQAEVTQEVVALLVEDKGADLLYQDEDIQVSVGHDPSLVEVGMVVGGIDVEDEEVACEVVEDVHIRVVVVLEDMEDLVGMEDLEDRALYYKVVAVARLLPLAVEDGNMEHYYKEVVAYLH